MQFYNLIRCISFAVYYMYILHVLPFWSASSYFKKKYMDLPQIDRC